MNLSMLEIAFVLGEFFVCCFSHGVFLTSWCSQLQTSQEGRIVYSIYHTLLCTGGFYGNMGLFACF